MSNKDEIDYHRLVEIAISLDPEPIDDLIFQLQMEGINAVYSKMAGRNKVFHTKLQQEEVRSKVQEIISFYDRITKGSSARYLWWYIHPHSTPITIGEYLEKVGFFNEWTLRAMELDPKNYLQKNPLNSKITLRHVYDINEHLELISRLWDIQFAEDETEDILKYMRNENSNKIYAFLDEDPVGIALYKEIQDFNYVYFYRAGVSPQFRGNGIYSCLLHHRVNIAAQAGMKIVTLSNKQTSYPILKSKGFQDLHDVLMYRYNFS